MDIKDLMWTYVNTAGEVLFAPKAQTQAMSSCESNEQYFRFVIYDPFILPNDSPYFTTHPVYFVGRLILIFCCVSLGPYFQMWSKTAKTVLHALCPASSLSLQTLSQSVRLSVLFLFFFLLRRKEFCELCLAKDRQTDKVFVCKKFLKKDGRKVRKAAKNEIMILKLYAVSLWTDGWMIVWWMGEKVERKENQRMLCYMI